MVAVVAQGDMTIGEVAQVLSVGVTCVKRRLRLRRAGEDLAPRHGGGSAPKLTESARELLRDTVALSPDVTLAECQSVLSEQGSRRVSVPTICRARPQLELPRKKSLAAREREDKARPKCRNLTGALESDPYVFMEEMGSHLALPRLYGRAAPGQRVCDQVPGDRGGNVSTIGAIGREGIRTGLSVPGPIAGETRLFFVEALLVPTLQQGDMVFRDNAPIHHLEDIEDASEAAGAWVLFLPTSSPDLNPIENCWAKGKAILRSLKPRPLPALLDALAEACASIARHDILGWFRHCGCRVAPT